MFSFYPTKNLGALGDGGAISTPQAGTAEILRAWREYGWSSQRLSTFHGWNSRRDELQVAILRGRLQYLPFDNARRRAIAVAYSQAGRESGIGLPSEFSDRKSVRLTST